MQFAALSVNLWPLRRPREPRRPLPRPPPLDFFGPPFKVSISVAATRVSVPEVGFVAADAGPAFSVLPLANPSFCFPAKKLSSRCLRRFALSPLPPPENDELHATRVIGPRRIALVIALVGAGVLLSLSFPPAPFPLDSWAVKSLVITAGPRPRPRPNARLRPRNRPLLPLRPQVRIARGWRDAKVFDSSPGSLGDCSRYSLGTESSTAKSSSRARRSSSWDGARMNGRLRIRLCVFLTSGAETVANPFGPRVRVRAAGRTGSSWNSFTALGFAALGVAALGL